MVDKLKAEARGFEGALHRMLRNEASFFVRLGAAIERADNTARLIDVKYHLLLPEGEKVGGAIDRDQWTTILHTVSAVTAYRWLYREGLRPGRVVDLLVLRPEMPRSIAASAEEVVQMLDRDRPPARPAGRGRPHGAGAPADARPLDRQRHHRGRPARISARLHRRECAARPGDRQQFRFA